VKSDATVHLFLIDALHFVIEAGEPVERFLEGGKAIEHRLRFLVPAFARNHDTDSGGLISASVAAMRLVAEYSIMIELRGELRR
jgi:hypothetical protein